MDFAGTLDNGRPGAFHTVDIPLAFDNVAAAGSRGAGSHAQTVVDRLSDALIAFARSGDPNHAGLPPGARTGLRIAKPWCSMSRSDPRTIPFRAERRFFARTPYVQPGT